MKKLLTIHKRVERILEKCPEARSNDKLLYYKIALEIDKSAITSSFGYVLMNLDKYHLPSFESVGRARRKVQERHPELRANDKVEYFRAKEEKKYEAYAKMG